MEIPSKEEVYKACVNEINHRLQFFNSILNDLKTGALNDAKSSAGDKHETALAMTQIEREKIGKQLKETEEMMSLLNKVSLNQASNKISLGSFIKTNNGFFYIAVAIGKLRVKNIDVFVISSQSPLAKKIIGLTIDSNIELNSKKVIIEQIY